jgi:outer membrane protein OmpA-like peptidoglycan-associated protein
MEPGRVENLGSPLNSERDDFAFLLAEDQKTGFVSSNRPGGKGDDDIYAVQVLKPLTVTKLLKGLVTDEANKPLTGGLFEIKDAAGKLLSTITTDDQGAFQYEVADTGTYAVVSVTPGKNPADRQLTVTENDPVRSCTIQLEKIPDWALAGIITNTEGQLLEGVTVKIKDLKTGFFRKFTTDEKGEFLNILKNVKLNDQIKYELKIEKSGYLSKTVQYQASLIKQGKLMVNESLDLSLSKLEAGMDLATMLQLKPIFFDKGKFNIRTDAAVELDKIVGILNEYPNMEIELGSHTDCRGSAKSNADLSGKRAEASAAYIKKRITNPERISAKGYGESQLVNGCACEGAVKSTCPEAVHQENRRTAFKIISVE